MAQSKHGMNSTSGPVAGETASFEEIVGCSLATAKIRIHRARARLKQALLGACSFSRDRDPRRPRFPGGLEGPGRRHHPPH